MKGKDIAAVLNFSSFRPEPDDPTAAWKRRFPNHRATFFGVGKQTLTVHPIGKNSRVGEAEIVPDAKELKEPLANIAPSLIANSEGGWCALSLNTRYVISLEANLSRRPGSETILKTNPRTVLGGRFERGKRYALTHNPETNSSILLTCDEEFVKKLETQFKEAGFQVGRVCCGAYILLLHALQAVNVTKGADKAASAFILVFCEGAVCALVQSDDKWVELRSRTDVYEAGDISPALDLVAPFQSRLPSGIPVVAVADTVLPGLDEALAQAFEGHPIQNLSQPNLLWNLMIQS